MSSRSDGLQINENMKFQRWEWVVQRIGWVLMAIVVVLALSGLFGGGILSRADVSDPKGMLHVTYQRFGRVGSAEGFSAQIHPSLYQQGEAQVWLSAKLLDGHSLDSIVPPPRSARPGADRCTFIFEAPHGETPTKVTFILTPRKPGSCAGQFGVTGGPSVAVERFVYP